ncbi:hypothetical protein EI983_03760 [Roseovarius faecimaris]|uniref:Uncharacterized protein n=1 Tax=Roseovarius faecimaris TaxID=2494550 RepID=A0A6I6INQ0_9RHOB|nr:hypothetical protein [Roseovarius faecimaris]QGX97443.1 hypothetical protein EI983_03760 [Roseovarius faecimaris]
MRKAFALAAVAAMSLPGVAKADGFKATDNCLQVLQGITDVDRVLLGAWIMGYLDNTNNQASLVRMDNAMTVLSNLGQVCAKNPQATILDVVQANQKNTADTPGTKAHAEAFLRQFLVPYANRVALTGMLRPTEAEIRAVYAEPLAGKLVAMYNEMYQPGVSIGPKQDQTEVILWRGTTGSLRDGAPVLKDFPGGYGDVRPYLQGNYPIVRFKFVEPGKTMGMAFDGLIFINDRWVLMPKPWRALGN